MSIDRITRVNSLLKREIGMAIILVMQDSRLDAASVTIVDVETSRDLKHAKVKVSIRDDQHQRKPILAFLRHHHAAIQDHLGRHVVLKYTPRVSFALDASVEKGNHVLDILSKMEPLEETAEEPKEQPPEPEIDEP
jgi:ribosome-binding factor A